MTLLQAAMQSAILTTAIVLFYNVFSNIRSSLEDIAKELKKYNNKNP